MCVTRLYQEKYALLAHMFKYIFCLVAIHE